MTSFFSFSKLLKALLPCFLLISLQSEAQIQRAEYFFDTDPGFGLGIPLSFTTPATDTSFTFNPAISSLSNGLHQLFVRTYDASKNVWGTTTHRFFYKEKAVSVALKPAIISAEYFFDADPGTGVATQIPVTAGQDVTFSFDADISGLGEGPHLLYVRVKDAKGRYSLRTPQMFFKYAAAVVAGPQIVSAEYFIDTDPGVGHAQTISMTPGMDLTFPVSIAVADLSNGPHRMYLRVKDGQGNWSIAASQLFYKEQIAAPSLATITQMEYFFDVDPGVGSGVPISFTVGQDITYTYSPAIAHLSQDNFHRLFVRAKNADGHWSLTASQLFFIPFLPPALDVNITKLEYYIDEDPGFGLANNIPFTPGLEVSLNFEASPSGLSDGIHRLALRAQDASGRWSMTGTQLFYRKRVMNVVTNPVVQAEYFIDADPGVGAATSVPVTAGQDITFAFSSSLTELEAGMHRLYVRTRDTAGNWNIPSPQVFYYEPVKSHVAADITKAEYFIDTDPGFGAATPLPVTPGQTITANFTEIIAELKLGMHRLLIRTQDAAGSWSVSASQLFYKDTLISYAPDAIQKMEWFWDTDPGFGQAQQLSIPQGKTELTQFSFNVPVPTSFSNEVHYLFVRAGADWGHTAVKVVDFSGIALPVTLLAFRAQTEGQQVRIDWQVAQEQNMDRYVVERSTDGREFIEIGARKATANGLAGAEYQLYDPFPVVGFNYYRLRQVELDGTVKYAPVTKVLFGGTAAVKVFPNPATEYFSLSLSQEATGIVLTDISGKIIRQYDPAQRYALQGIYPGNYLIHIIYKNNDKAIKTIVVQ